MGRQIQEWKQDRLKYMAEKLDLERRKHQLEMDLKPLEDVIAEVESDVELMKENFKSLKSKSRKSAQDEALMNSLQDTIKQYEDEVEGRRKDIMGLQAAINQKLDEISYCETMITSFQELIQKHGGSVRDHS
tara:strand:- start:40 stop:435 length:396 start_codon:yes stop_codon:yes gene_type:complete